MAGKAIVAPPGAPSANHCQHQVSPPTSLSILSTPAPSVATTRTVRCLVGARRETVVFPADIPLDQLKELFRAVGEAGPRDIIKLYDQAGRIVNIGPELEPLVTYRLEVVASQCNSMLVEEFGIDLSSLEERVCRLERTLRVHSENLPPEVIELKQQVDKFKAKLENTEHLSWLGFNKTNTPPLPTEPMAPQFRRTSTPDKVRVREFFMQISECQISAEVAAALRLPSFDPSQWEDAEMLLLLYRMFNEFELCDRFALDRTILKSFLYQVYKNYNEVPFHNFRHCFCVAQMMYSMICAADLITKLGHQEVLILLLSCICHDLDHPGYNNIYQINACTELALRYNDISPLENHHCCVAFRLLSRPECAILSGMPAAQYRAIREGVIRCILATDMARHNQILSQFTELLPSFDYQDPQHVHLLSMVLIKVADISNEARPMEVAEPWLDRLLQEFFKQSDAEKLEGLPVTPFMDREKITKPSSQCSFIGLVLLPLFEALGELIPELQELMVAPVRAALEHYRRLNEAERMHRKSVVDSTTAAAAAAAAALNEEALSSGGGVGGLSPNPPEGEGGGASPQVPKSLSSYSRKSLTSARSRSGEEDPGLVSGLHPNTNSDAGSLQAPATTLSDEHSGLAIDDDEEETETEVAVSEKALKFKISTETPAYPTPGSRKSSRDKPPPTTLSTMILTASIMPSSVSSSNNKDSVTTSPPASPSVVSPPPAMAPPPTPAVSLPCNGDERGHFKPPSLLARLRSLTERISLSDKQVTSSSNPGSGGPTSPLKKDSRETQTLPKSRGAAWRVILGRGGGSKGASLERLPPNHRSASTTSSPRHAGSLDSLQGNGGNGSCSSSGGRRSGRWFSGLRHSLRRHDSTPATATVTATTTTNSASSNK